MNRSLPESVRELRKSASLLNAQATVHDNAASSFYGGEYTRVVKYDLTRSMAAEIEKAIPVAYNYERASRTHHYTMTAVVLTEAELDVLLARAYQLGKDGK